MCIRDRLWACACIGLALGIGFYEGAFVILVLVLVTFVGLARLDRYVYMHSRVLELYIEVDSAKSIVELRKQLRKMDLRIAGFETMETMIRGDDTAVMTSIEPVSYTHLDVYKRQVCPCQ